VQRTRGRQHRGERRQNDERHNPRLHQLNEIADAWLDYDVGLTNFALDAHSPRITRISNTASSLQERQTALNSAAAPNCRLQTDQ
jgi:hypothetical protein